MRSIIFLSIVTCFVLCSCQKELPPLDEYLGNTDSTGTPIDSSTGSQLFKITQGVAEDTSYTVFYDTANRPAKIALSETDTFYISYDDNGNLAEIKATNNGLTYQDMAYTYSGAGLLMSIQGINFGQQEQYTFEYDGTNRLAKKSYFTSNGLQLALTNYFTYNFNTDGDIIRINEYNPVDTLIGASSITYTPEVAGSFKTYGLINYANILGYNDILNIDYAFNNHMPAMVNSQDGLTQFTYTKNAAGSITKIVSANSLHIFTHSFYYQ